MPEFTIEKQKVAEERVVRGPSNYGSVVEYFVVQWNLEGGSNDAGKVLDLTYGVCRVQIHALR